MATFLIAPGDAVIRSLLRVRYLAAVVSLLFAVHAIGFLALGVMRTVQAYSLFAQGSHWEGEARPGVHIAEAVDALLFALVMLVLAIGTTTLFLADPADEQRQDLPHWMRVKNLTELKLLLWEAILATLVVASATELVAHSPHLAWTNLLLPTAVLVLSVSYFLLKRTEGKD